MRTRMHGNPLGRRLGPRPRLCDGIYLGDVLESHTWWNIVHFMTTLRSRPRLAYIAADLLLHAQGHTSGGDAKIRLNAGRRI